jgi:hypothetical protein
LRSNERRAIVSADTDFGDLLARSNAAAPSILRLRRQQGPRAGQLARLLLANLDEVADDLDAGAIVVFDESRISDAGAPPSTSGLTADPSNTPSNERRVKRPDWADSSRHDCRI